MPYICSHIHLSCRSDIISNSYLVSLDPSRVVSAHEAAQRLIPSPASIEFVFEGHAALGLEATNVNETLLELLLMDEDVLVVEENQLARLQDSASPDRVEITTNGTWGLDYISWPLDNLYLWSHNGTGVTVYILDTGINLEHEEFYPNRASCGFEVLEVGTYCADFHGHGTNVASIVGGAQYGIAKGVSLKAVKVVDKDGGGSMATVVAGIDWVIADRQGMLQDAGYYPAIINLSVGGGVSTLLNDAIARAADSGILVVGAAGNQNGENACDMSPPSSNRTFTVGALDQKSEQAYFTNVGPCVDIFAPGIEILGAGINGTNDAVPRTGTSQASPHVTGLASLYMGTGLSADEARQAIIRDARTVEQLGLLESPPLAAFSGYVGTQSVDDGSTNAPSLAFTNLPSPQPSIRQTYSPTLATAVPTFTPTSAQPTGLPTGTPKLTQTTQGPTGTTAGPQSMTPTAKLDHGNTDKTNQPTFDQRSPAPTQIPMVATSAPSIENLPEQSFPAALTADSSSVDRPFSTCGYLLVLVLLWI